MSLFIKSMNAASAHAGFEETIHLTNVLASSYVSTI